MKKTGALWKLTTSLINTCFVFLLSLPLLYVYGFGSPTYTISIVAIFLLYELIVALTPRKVDLGNLLTRTRWVKKYPLRSHLIFAILYSLSFSTAFIWVLFPFDVLLFNLLLVQLPMVRATGYTLHGYLSGKIAGTRSV